MARLSKGADTWRSEGLKKRYEVRSPQVEERNFRAAKKKDTRKWCTGRVGREHKLYRHFYHHWDWISKELIIVECKTCHKEFYANTKYDSLPLEIPVNYAESDNDGRVQVKVNGLGIPFKYDYGAEWCKSCGRYHEPY